MGRSGRERHPSSAGSACWGEEPGHGGFPEQLAWQEKVSLQRGTPERGSGMWFIQCRSKWTLPHPYQTSDSKITGERGPGCVNPRAALGSSFSGPDRMTFFTSEVLAVRAKAAKSEV